MKFLNTRNSDLKKNGDNYQIAALFLACRKSDMKTVKFSRLSRFQFFLSLGGVSRISVLHGRSSL